VILYKSNKAQIWIKTLNYFFLFKITKQYDDGMKAGGITTKKTKAVTKA